MNPLRAETATERLSLHELSMHKAPFFASYEIHDPIDALSWLKENAHHTTIYWCSRDRDLEFAGIGLAETHYQSMQEAQERLASLPYPLRVFGGCSFSKNSDGWGHFGQERFWIPRILYIREGSRYVIQHCVLSQEEISSPTLSSIEHIPTHIPTKEEWTEQIERSYHAFATGDLQKIVIARQTSVEIPLHPMDALRTLTSQQTESFDFAFSPFGKSFFVGCSPELLLSIQKEHNKTILTEALAGTRPKEASPTELLQSDKEQREHRFVFAHILDRLTPFCTSTTRSAQPMICTHNHVIHLKTKIEGVLKEDVQVHELVQALHPTPAVCGLPQEQSMQRIEKWEGFDRGWYAGPVGWFGKDEAEIAVGIRSALFHKGKCLVWAGAGIVDGSQAHQEWQEIEAKSRQFLLLSQTES